MIESAEQLDACLGAMPSAVGLKVIDHLDEGALRWIAASPLAFLAVSRGPGVAATITGGEHGFARAVSPARLFVPRENVDDAELLTPGCGVGTLFLVPGVGETLRINGRVSSVTEFGVEVEIAEVYVHCAKALIRSAFWSAPAAPFSGDAARFVAETRFVAVASADAQGDADLSPKGDAAGSMLRWCGDALCYAERPGNRKKDSLRNLIAQPRAAVIAIIPGSNLVGITSGEVQLSDDSVLREQFAVADKTPRLVTKLSSSQLQVRESAALARARLWPLRELVHGLDPAAILTHHIKLNKTAGLGAGLMRKLVSKGLMNAGLQRDYKHNLY